jgi:hypothetical protein
MVISLGFLAFLLLPVAQLRAQENSNGQVLVQEGIADEPDVRNRAPIVSVRVQQTADNVKILADAFVSNKEYRRFPIRFQYFINRGLFASQYRSDTLPGPVGIDVGPDVATPPFNYTVIAELITPFGRNFSTVLEGAVFTSNLAGTFDCEFTTFEGDAGTIQDAEAISLLQQANNVAQFSATFREDESDIAPSAVDASLTFDNTSVDGTLTIRSGENAARTEAVSGNAVLDTDGQTISSFEVSSADASLELSCITVE